MSKTTTEEKWLCPECNVEMVGIGRREMKVPMIGSDGMGECAFHPNQYRCPACQAIAYNGAELIDQLRSRQKSAIGMQVIYASEKAIEAANRLHNRHNRIRGLWGFVAFLCGAIAISSLQPPSWWLYAMPFIAFYSIVERKNFTAKEVWDEVPAPENKASEESGVV